jgi:hypothetical protein
MSYVGQTETMGSGELRHYLGDNTQKQTKPNKAEKPVYGMLKEQG